jgi:hypothetical protein
MPVVVLKPKEGHKMANRKRPKKMKVYWIFEVNPHPTEFEIRENERRWQSIMEILFKPRPEGTEKELTDLSEDSREPNHDRLRPAKRINASFRCTECGAIWPATYLPDGEYAPDCYKCPNRCYKK